MNLYLSGDSQDVAAVAALFPEGEVKPIPLEGGVGSASALKMAFGGWNKIGSALTAQAYAIARAYGVEDALAGGGRRQRRDSFGLHERPGAGLLRWTRSQPRAERSACPMAWVAGRRSCSGVGSPPGPAGRARSLLDDLTLLATSRQLASPSS